MASATAALASGALHLNTVGDDRAGTDTVYGFNGNDRVATGVPTGTTSGGDRFLDDTGDLFDAALGYALAYENLLAQAWKGEPSPILQHLDWGGSCAPNAAEPMEGDVTAEATAIVVATEPEAGSRALADTDARLHTADDGDGDIAFADAGVGGGDFFGMT